MQVMTQQHTLLHRQALLLRAGEPLTEEDHARLEVQLVLHSWLCTCVTWRIAWPLLPE